MAESWPAVLLMAGWLAVFAWQHGGQLAALFKPAVTREIDARANAAPAANAEVLHPDD